MKFLVLFFFFFLANTYAAECTYEVNRVFFDSNKTEISVIRVSNADTNFNSVERDLIHRTLKVQSHYSRISQTEALQIFTEAYGEIVYFQVGLKFLVKVHFYPGDNQYGIIYDQKYQAHFKKVAEINDGDIYCI